MTDFQGKFVWYELMTTDTAAARAFYGDVVGWTARDSGMSGLDYTLLSANGADVAGIMDMPEGPREAGAGPVWIGYVAVADVDASAAKAQAAGGAIHRAPEDIPGVGRFAVVSDPYGASFCLFTALPMEGGGPAEASPMMPGHTGWHELMTDDLEGAFAFYSGLFGWEKGEAFDMGPMGIYQLFGKDGTMFGGMMKRSADSPAGWDYYFTVAEIRSGVERVRKAGGATRSEPMDVPGGAWIVHGTDPQGGRFSLVAPPA
ncbi:VOC family protein [Microbaculum sp. FT89]|uniref:VOC family protein n=1 Tax=Microbaculum sp. FT89 TaxID=3447298 RepID=UPI003F52EFC0